MRVRARFTHAALPADRSDTTHLVVSVTGDAASELRPPLGIVAVIDRSGSMASENKLGTVTAALSHLSTYLSRDDHVAVLAFDDRLEIVADAHRATKKHLAATTAALSALRPRGGTNISGALTEAIRLAARMAAADPLMLARVIVLTDGQPTHGITDPTALAGLAADLPERVSVSAIGVGSDCNHDMLGDLAGLGGGGYGFVEHAPQAAEVLGAEIGGLLNVAATDVRVRVALRTKWVTGAPGPIGAGRRVDEIDDDVWEVPLGSILADASRHVVLAVRSTARRKRHARPVTCAEVSVTGVVDDTDVTVEALPKITFGDAAIAADDDLIDIVDTARLAQAQADAEAAARAGRFDIARRTIGDLRLTSPSIDVLRTYVANTYDDGHSYTVGSIARNSMSAMLSGSGLLGSSAEFNSVAMKSVGSYTTAAQRDVANETAQAVSGAHPHPAKAESRSNDAQATGQWSSTPAPTTTGALWLGGDVATSSMAAIDPSLIADGAIGFVPPTDHWADGDATDDATDGATDDDTSTDGED